jgi:phage terminase large subunit-like protein
MKRAGSECEHFIEFCETHLELSTDRWAGQKMRIEPFQRRLLDEALSYDEAGFPLWRSIVFIVARKNAKTQLLAAYAVYRLLTSDDGPEILLAAASDRNAGRLFKAAASFIRRSPVLSELATVRDYLGEIARSDGKGIIYRVASNPYKLHGYDPSLVVLDELAQWVQPSNEQCFAALTSGGGARGAPQTFTITTAGEAATRASSILGRMLDAAEETVDRVDEPGLHVRRLEDARMLVWNYEAPTLDPFDIAAMKLANPASWITEEYLATQAANPELTDAQVLQLHGCVWAAAEQTFVAPEQLQKALADRRLEEGTRVVLGFDGSERRDETWLVACSLDGHVEPLGRWAKPRGAGDEWRIPRPEVHRAVADAFARFNVVEFAADPPGWYAECDQWTDEYGDSVVLFETRQPSRMAPACERVRTGLNDGEMTFGGPLALVLRVHFGNCIAYETPYGVAVTKDHKDSPRKIDGAVAAIIAYDRAMWNAANAANFDPDNLFIWA